MKRNEKGQVLVLVALAIFVLLGFAALGIDVGYMYSVRHELQRSADAGALAGASAFRQYGKDSKDTTVVEGTMMTWQVAEARAIDYATRDQVSTSIGKLTPSEVSVSFPTTPNLMRVRVDVHRNTPLFFARILGWINKTIPAFAVAEAYPVTSNLSCVVPWGIPAPWADDGDGVYEQGEGDPHWPPSDNVCNDQDYDVTKWSYVTHDNVDARSTRDQYICEGSLQVLKIGDPKSSSIPGNFYGINLGPLVESCPDGVDIDNGANFYRYMIKNPCSCTLKIDLNAQLPSVPTEPGMMVGPTLKATAPDEYFKGGGEGMNIPGNADTNSLMNQDRTGFWNDETNLPDSHNDLYAGTKWADSPRVVRIPVYNPNASSNGGLNTPPGGSAPFQPLGFVGFWLQDVVYTTDPITGKELGKVVGRYVTVPGLGGGGGGESEGTILNIRLVE